ncbi:hypothetical protein JCM11251_001368 [Rhodosporidiobolus azoricus]
MSTDSYSIGSEDKKSGGLSSLFHRTKDRLPEFSSFPHQLRQGAVLLNPNQLAETKNLQLCIKAYSGVIHDHQALGREGQVFSKTLFTWSKEDKGADIVDVCDRLAFLQFKTAELQLEAAGKLEGSRAVLKDIRNFENDLVPRRRNAASTAAKITSLQKEQKQTAKVQEQIGKLSAELAQLEAENATFEASFDTLKRTKLHEAFSLQFAAQKELAEKTAMVAGYGELLLQGMETDGVGEQYRGKDRTARVKAELEQALARWRPSAPPTLQDRGGPDYLDRSDTRSFGETHSIQLSELDNASTATPFTSHDHASLPGAGGRVIPPVPEHTGSSQHEDPFHDQHIASASTAPPLPRRPSPAPSPSHALSPTSPTSGLPINLSPTVRPDPSELAAIGSPPREMSIPLPPPGFDPTSEGMAPPEPTVAETGAPKIGTGGPSSGQLRPRSSSLAKGKQPEGYQQHLDSHDAIASAAVQGSGASIASQDTYDPAGWGAGAMPGGFSRPISQTPTWATSGSTMEGGEERLPGYGEGDDEAARARDRAERILADERERKANGGAA